MTETRMGDIAVAMLEFAVAALVAEPAVAAALGETPGTVAARIWDSTPPTDAQLPYIALVVPDPVDVGGIAMAEVMSRGLLTAKVVGQVEAYDPLTPTARAIHKALHGRVNVPLSGGGTLFTSRRVRSLAYPEQTDGIEYRHLGGMYEVIAQ
jgi:hypothetical protein